MKQLALSLALTLAFSLSRAQTAPLIQWQKSLGGSSGEGATSIQQTTDGGYIAAGSSTSNDGNVSGNHGNYDYWIVKLKKNGTIQWQKSLGGTKDDEATSIQQTSDNGYIVAGSSHSNDGDVSGHHGNADYWIVKLKKNGTIQWQKALGGSDGEGAASIQQTSDGGYIAAGYSHSNDGDVSGNHGASDYWIVKLTKNGDIAWQRSLGGTKDDKATSIQQTTDGGYIVAGSSYSNDGDVSGNHGSSDYWIVKLTKNGDIAWQKCHGGGADVGIPGTDDAYSIQQTSDGGYIAAGSSFSFGGDVGNGSGSLNYWIVKLNKNGDISWQNITGGFFSDRANSVRQTSDGGYIVAGYSESAPISFTADYWIVKLAKNGNVVWTDTLGGTSGDFPNSIRQTSDSGYVVAGSSSSNDGDVSGNHGSTDYWIVKLTKEDLAPVTLKTTTFDAEKQNKNAGKDFTIYPNPSSGSFTIDLNVDEEGTPKVQVQVINLMGQIIFVDNGQLTVDNGTLVKEIQLSDGVEGMYLVKVTVNDRVYSAQINLQK